MGPHVLIHVAFRQTKEPRARIDARATNSGGSEPLTNSWTPYQTATLLPAKNINTPVRNPWRGRVAVLLESGVPRLPQKRRSARISSAIVRSEISPPREAVVPRFGKNRPFHAR